MDSQAAKTIADFLVAEYQNEMQTTLRVIAAVPTDRLDYRPDARSKCGLELVRHLTVEDEWFLNSIADGAFGGPPDDGDGSGLANAAEAAARYKERMPPALDRVYAMSGEQLTTVIDFFGKFQLSGLSLLSLAMKHSVHHRGQLSAYLRAMGGKVPGIYGPSADSQ
jgi:uncharacterized damage-inducible protein DinB